MKLESITRLYERMLMAGAALTPAVAIWYLASFSAIPALRFEDYAFHEWAIAMATVVGGFISYVSWRSYRESGEIFLRWLTVGFLAFTLIYALHGLLTRTAHHNIWLFLLYGPVSRFVMLGCLVFGLAQYGRARESPAEVSRRGFWWRWLAVCLVMNIAVGVLAYSPFAGSPWVRLSLESGAVILCLLGVVMMAWRRIQSPLMVFYAIALVLFAQAAIAFMLAKPWNHMWWLAHAIFAGGFFVLSWGVARALLTTRSFALAYSQEQMMRSLEREKAQSEAANRELQMSQVRLQAVLDSVQDCVITIDTSGIVGSFNQSAEKVFAYSADEVVGRNVIMLMPESYREVHELHLQRIRDTGARTVIGKVRELLARRKDGSVFTVELLLNETKVEGESLFTGSLRDITERKQAADELEQHRNHLEKLVSSRTAELALAKDAAEAANLAKSAFLATMSHELRTPLNAILGLSYLVGRELGEPKLRGQVDAIRSAGQQLLGMVDQILDMTRLEADTLTIEDSDFALTSVLDAPAKAWRERAAAKGLGFALELDPALPPFLRGDPQRLGQMLAILVDNAIKFSDRGRIELRVRLLATGNDGLLLRFEVADQGIGIDAAQQAVLFDRFAQADSSMTRKYGGIGLALSICKRLAELMGGEVGVDSTPNVGSTFWFSARLQRGKGMAATAVADGLAADPVAATPAQEAAATATTPLTAEALQALLDQLDALLAQSDIAAITLFDEHAAELRATLGEPGARLGHEISQFAFEAARETVRALRSLA